MANRTGYVEVHGGRLYYETSGSGTPLVFVHGFSLDMRMWDDQFELYSRRYRVIRYDLRGFGRSSLPDGPYSHYDDLRALLGALDAVPAHVVGLSLGSGIAVDLALTSPGAVRSLVLVAVAAISGFVSAREYDESITPIWDAARTKGIEAAKEVWLAHAYFAPAREQPDAAERIAEIVGAWSGWQFVNPNPARHLQPPAIGRLGALHVPTLIVMGERDLTSYSHPLADVLERGIPGAKRIVLPGAGHMTNMEAPGAFDEAVLPFLTEVDAG